MKGYDQWKTASPYDDSRDDICYHCGLDLEDWWITDGEWLEDGYCSERCRWDHESGFDRPAVVRPIINAFWDLFGSDWVFDIDQLSRAIYKGTECGAWVAVDDNYTLKVGSIVEGSDAEVGPVYVTWDSADPIGFKKRFWNEVEDVNARACAIWDECHCDICHGELGWDEEWRCGECREKEGANEVQSDRVVEDDNDTA